MLTDESPMPFGMHKEKGFKMIDVPAKYLLWLYDNNKCTSQVKDYIVENLDVIKLEAFNEKDKLR